MNEHNTKGVNLKYASYLERKIRVNRRAGGWVGGCWRKVDGSRQAINEVRLECGNRKDQPMGYLMRCLLMLRQTREMHDE